MPYKMPAAVQQAFQARGWVLRQGNLYFDGRGGTAHPHLHMMLEARGTVRDGVIGGQGTDDIRSAVKMLAWSDGQQGRGGGGRTLIRRGGANFVQGTVNFNVANEDFIFAPIELRTQDFHFLMAREAPNTSQDLNEEMAWIWSYFNGG